MAAKKKAATKKTAPETAAPPQGKAAPPVTTAALIPAGLRGVQISSIDDLWRVAEMVRISGMAPSGMDTQAMIAVAMEKGMEAGLTWMNALQSIHVIKGLPSWSTKAALGLVRSKNLLSRNPEIKCTTGHHWARCDCAKKWKNLEGWPEEFGCNVKLYRVGDEVPVEGQFTVGEAKQARLWMRKGRSGEPTPWITYPRRMLYARALGFALDDGFGDALGNMPTVEVIRDMPASVSPKPQTTSGKPPDKRDPLLGAKDVTPQPEAPQ